ncbi:MAG: universal stress protein, partial [Candidatus Methylomirabilales bacterium]
GRTGLASLLLGSVSRGVAEQSAAPVLVVKVRPA